MIGKLKITLCALLFSTIIMFGVATSKHASLNYTQTLLKNESIIHVDTLVRADSISLGFANEDHIIGLGIILLSGLFLLSATFDTKIDLL